jgi:hypothetical protein
VRCSHVDDYQRGLADRRRILIIFVHPDKSDSVKRPVMTYS